MRHIQTYIAVTLLGSLILVFLYSTLNTEIAYRRRAVPEDNTRRPTHLVHNVAAAVLQSTPIPEPVIFNVSVSDALRETIPHSKAYWNRLLYLTLGQVKNGIYSFKRDANWSHCKETSQEILQTNVYDFNNYPDLFRQFLLYMNCRFPPVLIDQPNKCMSRPGDSDNGTFLLFAIKSNPGNFVRRQAVRETWGQDRVYQNGLRVRTVFLLGSSPLELPDVSLLLSFESRQFGDLLQWDFHESLLNLTLKANVFLRWAMTNCPNVSFVFSGDDDVFVNTPAVLEYLTSLEPSKASQSYIGQIINTASPQRDAKNKYYIPISFYDGPYPAYAGGGGFLISGALLRPLYYISHVLPLFPIDDVYIGMCFKALGISPEAHLSFQTFDVQEQDRENLCVHKALFLIHQRTPRQMKKLWKGIHSPLLTC